MPRIRKDRATFRAAVFGVAAACVGASAVPSLAADAGDSLAARPTVMLGRTLHFRGTLKEAAAGTPIVVQRLERDGAWVPTATATATSGGAFLARWRTDHIGRFTVRAVRAGGGTDAAAAAAAPTTNVAVYKPATATWYGPGFYGHKTACGIKLTHALLGVAHRSLPCGTQIEISYNGKTITVPVVDRGPFAHGARWDLTSATAEALGFTVTDTIGALALRGAAPAPAPAPALPADPSGGATAG